VLFDVSSKIVNAVVERPVERVDPVHEDILNADVHGIGKTRGNITVRLIPSDSYALLELVFLGQTQSRTLSFDEPVKAYTKNAINFEVDKTIVIADEGLRGYCARPAARAAVCLEYMTDFYDQVNVNAVDVGRQFFRAARCDIERETSRKAVAKLGPRFDQDVQVELDKANQALAKLRKSLPPLKLKWNTGADRLGVQVSVGSLAPTSPPPALPASDAAVRLHQDVLRDAARIALAGKKLTLLELANMVESVLGPVLGGTKPGANAEALAKLFKTLNLEPPTINFAYNRPMVFDFVKDGFSITLHGTSYTSGKTTYPDRYIRAIYKVEKTATGFAAVREGLPQVRASFLLPDTDETAEDKAARSFLESAFGLFFPARMDMGEVTVPLEGSRPIVLAPADARFGDGWMMLAWTHRSPAAPR
jgi:hypothetical protein